MNVEVERLVNNVVTKVINEEMIDIDLGMKDVNATKISEIENRLDKKVQDKLLNIDNGELDKYFIPNRIKTGRFKNVKNGILCDISIGSIRGSTFFANIGPTIPIKLLFSSGLNSNVVVDVDEYGINNAIIKVYYTLSINEQITMPISSKRRKINIKKLVYIDIINGKIPNYYTGLIK